MTGSHSDALLARIEARQSKVAVVGLGYVGLPLAMATGRAGFPTLGFDIDPCSLRAFIPSKAGGDTLNFMARRGLATANLFKG